MARSRHEYPTPAELEVLQVLRQRGPCTVRQAMRVPNPARPRAYTSVMGLMNVMAQKGLLPREPEGRTFVYTPGAARKRTPGGMAPEPGSTVTVARR